METLPTFEGCKDLKSVDLSTIDTTGIMWFDDLFNGCSSLEEINLSGWDLTHAESLDHMFAGCLNLKRIKLYGSNAETIRIVKKHVYEDLYFYGFEHARHRPVFEYDTISDDSISELGLECRCGSVARTPLSLDREKYPWARIAAYHNCLELVEGLPVAGSTARIVVKYPVYARVVDTLSFDFAENTDERPTRFMTCRLKDIVYMSGSRALVDVDVLEVGDITTFVRKDAPAPTGKYDYLPPQGDSKPTVERISTQPLVHVIWNQFGGGDAITSDYILTDAAGLDHLVKSDQTIFHTSTTLLGNLPLAAGSADWIISRRNGS